MTDNPKFPHRCLISAINIHHRLQAKYPDREVIPSVYCNDNEFYWFGYQGSVRKMLTKNGAIWECDKGRGFPWMKLIRTVKEFKL